MISVKLLHVTPIEVAIKAIEKPYKNEEADEGLLENVSLVRKHESVLEHIYFNFEVKGLPRYALQELARHRIASYTVESTRYCLGKMIREWKMLGSKFKSDGSMGQQLIDFIDKYYDNPFLTSGSFSEELTDENYKSAIFNIKDLEHKYDMLMGYKLDGNIEERVEDLLKPFLIETKLTELVFSINLRSLRNFLSLRADKHAHFGIREMALQVKGIVMGETEFGDFVVGAGALTRDSKGRFTHEKKIL